MHVGGICTNGIFCTVTGGNRDLRISISIAPSTVEGVQPGLDGSRQRFQARPMFLRVPDRQQSAIVEQIRAKAARSSRPLDAYSL